MFARTDWVSRNVCATLSGYAPVMEARWAPDEGRQLRLGQVHGCYLIRHIVVCEEGNAACLRHLARRPGRISREHLQADPPR
jgi:hypothetical protein